MKEVLKRIGIVLGVTLAIVVILNYIFAGYADMRYSASAAKTAGGGPVEPVTISDVLEANIPSPTVAKVSTPGMSYNEAFPDATDEPEVVIESYGEAPMLANPETMREDYKPHFTEPLPPVEERLPLYPAVVRGPDGVGLFGGEWKRATPTHADISRKIGYESFVRFDPSGNLQPALAYRWTVENGNRVFTFYLRKGHKWSDGEPFTTQDILWAMNEHNGSPTWPDPSDWMQAEDGYIQLYENDILDWNGLATRILEEAQTGQPTPASQILAFAPDVLREQLNAVLDADGEPSKALRKRVVVSLNQAFRNAGSYKPAAWTVEPFEREMEERLATGLSGLDEPAFRHYFHMLEMVDLYRRSLADPDTIADQARSKLMLGLFRAAFRDFVKPAEKRRCQIVAVPDENGDDSHIIRFIFDEPNAIFLEKTATFQFYRGIFESPRHRHWVNHVNGSDRVEAVDFLDWKGFATLATNPDSGSGVASRVAQQLRAELNQSAVDVLRKISESNDDPAEADKSLVVEAVNDVFLTTTFYDPSAWEGIDWSAERDALMPEGYADLMRDRAGRERVQQIMVREELLQNVKNSGIETLSDENRYMFNQMMFRAAFDDKTGPGLIAYNREHALNIKAANHPNQYSSWTSLFNNTNAYDKELNPHPPTLRAWRGVSESKDQVHLAVRNPYYYRVDSEGNQLPYLDAIRTDRQTEKPNILLTLAGGSVTFQARDLSFEDFTYLKQNEERGNYQIRLWASDQAGEIRVIPIQPHLDPMLEEIYMDRRFRYALSHGLNRQQIIDVVYAGMGEPAQFAVPEASKYYSEVHANTAVDYDPEEANRLLDEMGLTERNSDGIRLLPDGSPFIMNLETAPSGYPLVLVEILTAQWRKIGIDARMKIRAQGLTGRLISMGVADVVISTTGASYFGPILAGSYAPTHPAESQAWAPWVTYLTNGGRSGTEPPPFMYDIQRMWEEVINSETEAEKVDAWSRLSERAARDLPVIGIMKPPGVLVYVHNDLRNVPDIALAGWIAHEPGNSCPEAFFLITGEPAVRNN